jgi:hypothetical protein
MFSERRSESRNEFNNASLPKMAIFLFAMPKKHDTTWSIHATENSAFKISCVILKFKRSRWPADLLLRNENQNLHKN